LTDTTFRYCPTCATPLVERVIDMAPRQVCPQCQFVHYLDPKVVVIVVIHHEGKLLLGKRNHDPGKGLWSFFGGYVDRGEPVEEAAAREVREETGLTVQIGSLIGIYSACGDPNVLIVYQADLLTIPTETTLLPPSEEISELALFPLAELPALAFSIDARILRDWRQRNHL
jgi:8-oxo-dGTP pyrophosphatase MutT (NUDIX family)